MNELLCRLVNLLLGSDRVNTPYNSQLAGPGIIQANPVSVPSQATPNSTGQTNLRLLPANRKRKQVIIVNVGTQVVAIKWGGVPSIGQQDWTFLLQASAVAGDGTGGVIIDEMWKGEVYAQAASGTGSVNVTELV